VFHEFPAQVNREARSLQRRSYSGEDSGFRRRQGEDGEYLHTIFTPGAQIFTRFLYRCAFTSHKKAARQGGMRFRLTSL